MEEKTMFPCVSNEGQKVNENVMADESSSEVSGGILHPDMGEWQCCGQMWGRHDKCGVCGANPPKRLF